MERHVDAGHQDERPPATADFPAPLDLGFELLQTANGSRDRILGATEVVVHDLQEFTGALRDLIDEVGHVVVVEINLGRADRAEPVVRAARGIPRHDVVHLRPAMEHDLEKCLKRVHTAHARERGVLADRVPASHGTLYERALLAHLGHLGGSHRRHRDLGELRQVEHPLGVVVVHTGGDEAGRVVAHHVQHREAEGFAGELVRRIPDLACGLGPGTHVHAHALGLDALAGEGVDGLGRGQLCRRRHHEVRAHPGGHLDDFRPAIDTHPVHPEFDLVAGQHHPQES